MKTTPTTMSATSARHGVVKGNWEIVEWNGRRLLRNTGPRDAAVRLRLPESLPETFTIEMEVYLTHPNHQLAIFPGEPASMGKYDGQFFYISPAHGTGVKGRGEGTVESTNNDDRLDEELISVRFMVDGTYVKAYVGERRVANAPNVTLPRPDVLQIHNTYSASEKNPILIGTIRVAGGGRDLYDVLEEQGRVTTRGILFAVNSDRIRAESTGTLKEIGTMLQEHPGLSLSIEGHTDSDGEEAFNQDLSERRAAAVKDYLVSTFGIEEQRLETAGFGESMPVADNDTPEGKQENRRVELVRLGT